MSGTKQNLVVQKDNVKISVPNKVSVTYGDFSDQTLKFGTIVVAVITGKTVSGTLVYTVNGTDLSKLSSGLNVGVYDVIVSFTPTDTKNYNSDQITVTGAYTVSTLGVNVSLSLVNSLITYGTMCTSSMFVATAVDDNGNNIPGTFAYTINGQPFVDSLLDAGTYEIDVIFTPTGSSSNNYVVSNNGKGNSKNSNGKNK